MLSEALAWLMIVHCIIRFKVHLSFRFLPPYLAGSDEIFISFTISCNVFSQNDDNVHVCFAKNKAKTKTRKRRKQQKEESK